MTPHNKSPHQKASSQNIKACRLDWCIHTNNNVGYEYVYLTYGTILSYYELVSEFGLVIKVTIHDNIVNARNNEPASAAHTKNESIHKDALRSAILSF